MKKEPIICDFNKGDNIFEFGQIPENITTVNNVLEAIEFKDDKNYKPTREYSNKTKRAVTKLDEIHAKEDDLFDTETNKVMRPPDILKKYGIKMI